MDNHPISSNTLEKFYDIDGEYFGRQYKEHLSDYKDWEQLQHAENWVLFPENLGPHLSIDETALTNGDLYTVLTNKTGKGRKGCLVAMIKGTKSDDIITVLEKITKSKRLEVKEVTLDMAPSMRRIVINCFPNAQRVIDRFHVQKLAIDALQEIRIARRWDAINEETEAMEQAKYKGETFKPFRFPNGDTPKQLLARSRYLLFKSAEKWTDSQKQRAKLLFAQYPDLKEAYSLTHSLRMIFSKNKVKGVARLKLARWYNQVAESGFKSFNTIAATIYEHYEHILNYFDNRSTNASAESFNAKIKAFRSVLRGVVDVKFFLYRFTKIYA